MVIILLVVAGENFYEELKKRMLNLLSQAHPAWNLQAKQSNILLEEYFFLSYINLILKSS